MKGQDIGYIRVSSLDQNPARQLQGLVLDRTFLDTVSGSTRKRPQLESCLQHLRAADTLHVHSIDRLARNLADLQSLIKTLTEKGVSITFHKESLTFSPDNQDALSNLMLQMMGAFAEFERELIKERQREGIAVAKTQGKRIGQPPKLTQKQIKEIRQRRANRESVADLAKEYGVARQTVYSVLKLSVETG